jgi:O-antigen biosynthesis protein
MPLPFVSVVVLNYNSLRFLDGCLGSLTRLDYPKDRYEVVVVDNLSSDGSAEIAEERFPDFRIVRNDRNLGFAGGNNVAMRASQADYVVLLNNDTAVDQAWLSKLVEAAETDPRVGACCSKLLFMHDRVRLQLQTEPFRPRDFGSTDQRELGIRILEARVEQPEMSRPVEYLKGFHGQEQSPDGPFRWSEGKAVLGLRVSKQGGEATLRMVVAAPRQGANPVPLSLSADGTELGHWEVGGQPTAIDVPLPPKMVERAGPVIQNAGNLLLREGSGRDRGTVVRGTEVYQEDDLGQYDRREEVFAGCGAALLLRKRMLDEVGLFDEDFFMYYEDMDLSWRARRRGWKVLYVPESVVRHIHAASSVEWSPLFTYHVERNRLIMLAKNAPLDLALGEHLRYATSLVLNLGRFSRAVVLRSPDLAALTSRIRIQLRVTGWLVAHLFETVAKRRRLAAIEEVPASKLMDWMVTG